MWTQTFALPTGADPEALWRVLSDVPGWVRWNGGVERIEVDGPTAVGMNFVMTPPGEDPLPSTLVAVEAPRLLTDLTELDGVSVRVEHRLDPGPDGRTTIVYAITISGDLPDEVLADIGTGISADFPEVMAALAAAAG